MTEREPYRWTPQGDEMPDVRVHGSRDELVSPTNLGDWEGLARQLGVQVKKWRPGATAMSTVMPSISSPSPPQVPSAVPGWFADPFAVSHKRYFDGSGWTHHTLTADGEWKAHTPWGDPARDSARAWVARNGRIREAPLGADGKVWEQPHRTQLLARCN